MKEKVLIIEAHSDDSAISIGGFLEKYRDKYEYHFALMVNSDITLHHYGFISKAQRLQEYKNYVEHFNGTLHTSASIPFDYDARMDMVPKRDVVAAVEKIIDTVRPSILLCQGPSFHHDHTVVYESVIAATRPTSRFCPNSIFVMENPTYVHSLGPQTDFSPTVYVNLTAEILQKKLQNYRNFFPSQIRDDENYLSEEGLKSWARYRGIESRCLYAEALQSYIQVL